MRGYVSIDVNIDDVISELSNSEKQELVDELFKECVISKKDKSNLDDDFDLAVEKLIGNKHLLTIDEEDVIRKIAERIVV